MYKKLVTAFGCTAILALSSTAVAEGNRYGVQRDYHSEISAAEAYLLTNHDKGNKSKNAFSNAVIIDVRTIDEFVEGHPPKSVNIPYPHVYHRKQKPNPGATPPFLGDGSYIGQDPVQFVNDVMAAYPDKSTPILTLCRTGGRSIAAANLLAAVGYNNVRNIWQGFVGQLKTQYLTSNVFLDLNNNDIIHGVTPVDPADPDGAKESDIGDLDGWSGYQGLPVETKLHPKRIYKMYEYLYYE